MGAPLVSMYYKLRWKLLVCMDRISTGLEARDEMDGEWGVESHSERSGGEASSRVESIE